MILYLLTITAYKKDLWLNKDKLDDVIRWLSMAKGIMSIESVVYETSGLYNQLHIHALASTTSWFSYSPWSAYGDDIHCIAFRVYWKRIAHAERDKSRIRRYLEKDCSNAIEQEQILEFNHYHGYFYDCDNNLFIRTSGMKTVTLAECL